MNTRPPTTQGWHEANQRYLTAALAEVGLSLEQYGARCQQHKPTDASPAEPVECLAEAATALPAPPALERLCQLFGLSSFERRLLLMCAGVELDGSFARLCASAMGDELRAVPSFSLALAALPEPHWSALSPAGPLRYWRLIEVTSGDSLARGALRIDERILHYLTGVQYLDERLADLVTPVRSTEDLVPSHRALAERLAATWSGVAGNGPLPVVQLCGAEGAGRRTVAAAACTLLGLDLYAMPGQAVPTESREIEALARLWDRESALAPCALLLECGERDAGDPGREAAFSRFIDGMHGALIVAGRERRSGPHRPMITLEMARPTPDEQRALWRKGLGPRVSGLNGDLDSLVTQFNLDVRTIQAVCAGVSERITAGKGAPPGSHDAPEKILWDACRVQARPHLENLAQRIHPVATWSDLVLPEPQMRILREIAVHVRQRMKVYETWGFAAKNSRGLGITALFAGPSGTGKTMAAEVLANELQLDLNRIDLSQVVNKYIGETEKNLRRVFDAAEEGGAILLFDEADALFGRRSEVKDSHDRYANIEVSYLLQRMESYRGLAVLTTNMKSALDTAFLRRIRFVVQFPFPDAAQRAEIWRRIFPADTPREGLDVERLARLAVTGGNIRNIALNAAFLAADAGEPVRMGHLLRAARTEYGKLEKSLTDAEIRGWE
jgi:hypothetical protein